MILGLASMLSLAVAGNNERPNPSSSFMAGLTASHNSYTGERLRGSEALTFGYNDGRSGGLSGSGSLNHVSVTRHEPNGSSMGATISRGGVNLQYQSQSRDGVQGGGSISTNGTIAGHISIQR